MNARSLRNSPLFWIPSGEFERQNEWCEPKVIAFGDMDILMERDLSTIADSYFRCADALIDQVFKHEIEDFVAQFPIIYLMRHSFEVRLKEIYRHQTGTDFPNEHSLQKIMNGIQGLDSWASKRIQELNTIDPDSELLRYGGVGGKAKSYLGTELRFFRGAMTELRGYLAAFAISAKKGSAK